MRLRNNIFTALLLAIGFILHHITPGILGGMKFDFLLSFMFVSLLLNPKLENAIVTGLLGGILSAMTTTFPGGQIPNMLDKVLTCLILFIFINFLRRYNMNTLIVALIGGLGTFISGMIFLISAAFIVGLPVPIEVLIISIVVPTTILNAIGIVFVYRLVKIALKASRIAIN